MEHYREFYKDKNWYFNNEHVYMVSKIIDWQFKGIFEEEIIENIKEKCFLDATMNSPRGKSMMIEYPVDICYAPKRVKKLRML